MTKRELLNRMLSFWIYYRWHPEVALRYLPIVEEIKSMGNNLKILDIGSGGLGIAPYLNRKISGLDVSFSPPYDKRLERIIGSADNIPFESNSFDVAISVDMFEHLNPRLRSKAISEMIRVAKRKVIIAVPCGKKSHIQDINLNSYHKRIMKRPYKFLVEQIDYGLPDFDDISNTIKKLSSLKNNKYKFYSFGNESLKLRAFLMKGWITKNIYKDFFFRKLLLLAIPLFRRMNDGPYYRGIFVVNFDYENSN